MRIYKYPVPIEGEFYLNLPANHQIITFQVQNGQPCVWIRVDAGAVTNPVKFAIIGTGHEYDPSEYGYIGTIQLEGFVWHLHEQITPS